MSSSHADSKSASASSDAPTNVEHIAKPKGKKQKKEVVDSWEDEDVSSDSDDGGGVNVEKLEIRDQESRTVPSAPPPTPSSPLAPSSYQMPGYTVGGGPMLQAMPQSQDSVPSRRPEKTDAVARRMIAGALGLRAPKPTEEQRAYERSIREQERKRRDEERLEEQKKQEEAAKARAAVWDD